MTLLYVLPTGAFVKKGPGRFYKDRIFIFDDRILKQASSISVLPKKTNTMWAETNNKLYKSFQFKDFSEAFSFMTRVALLAEKNDHHPTWINTYNKVEIWLNTHDAGDVVTDKDRSLATEIDKLLK